MPLKSVQTLLGHTDRVWTIAWNPNGSLLASSGSDKTIRIWARESDKWACVSILTETHLKSIRRVCWSPCGRYLASASFDSTVCIWKRSQVDGSWSTIVNLEGHENEVKSVAWSHDGQFLASCGRDRTVWIWERASENSDEEVDIENASSWDCSDVKNDHTKDVKHIVWHPHHNILVSCSYDDTVKLFHKHDDDWKCFETLSSHTSTVWSADFSPSGELLATCGDDKTVRVWRNHANDILPEIKQHSWKCTSVIQGYHNRTIYDVSWSKLNDVIVSASGDNSLAVYGHSQCGNEVDNIFMCIDKLSQSHDCDVNCVAWNDRVSGLFASGSDDCTIKLWEYSNGKGMRQLTIVDEILTKLVKSCSEVDLQENSPNIYTLNITDFSNLLCSIQSLQLLQSELNQNNDEITMLENLLDLKITDSNLHPVDLSNLHIGEDSLVDKLSIKVSDYHGEVLYIFNLIFDRLKFTLQIPKRSVRFLTVANELFLMEKTGDLFKILDSGLSQFLLGHLFTFSDLKLVTKNNGKEISFIISADRDEKIRISNYPDTFKIERYCFGHRCFIKRLIIVDDRKFISIDQQNILNLWNLDDLRSTGNHYLKPEKTVPLNESTSKRLCVHSRFTKVLESNK